MDDFDAQFNPPQEVMNTFFVRALYDYQSNDPSSLSFQRGALIEVLTQLESGWWDGLLDEERGWFPSNYVVQVSDQEAEEELAIRNPNHDIDPNEDLHNQVVDALEAQLAATSSDPASTEWLEDFQNPVNGAAQTDDFWMPEVTSSGQVSVTLQHESFNSNLVVLDLLR